MSLNNPLWQSALQLYRQPGVEAAALALQQAGCSVNRLLMACFLARRGQRLVPDLLAGEALEWQRELTQPLRRLRYTVRRCKAERAELEPCYRALRDAELACEQVELMLLWEALSALELPAETPGRALARANLERVLEEAGVKDSGRFDARLEVFVAAVFPDPLAGG